MVFIRVNFVLWRIVFGSLQGLSALARKLLIHTLALPALLLPDEAIIAGAAVSRLRLDVVSLKPQ